MANTIGIKVLHPGGYTATDKLCALLNLNENTKVLDLACGVGTTSFYLSKKFKCKITGIDISSDLINIANSKLTESNHDKNITFQTADALKMPFPDNSFDVVIAQAFFILIDNKDDALKEIFRVVKPGGFFGSLELSWFKTPPKKVYEELLENTCTTFIPRTSKFEEWEEFFKSVNFTHISTVKNPMPAGIMQMLKAEGLVNFLKIIFRMMCNNNNRKKMMSVQNAFNKYNDYLGFGIYCLRK